jgi:hypothetical protein
MLIENGPPQAIKVKFDLQQISLQYEGQSEDITGFPEQSCHWVVSEKEFTNIAHSL